MQGGKFDAQAAESLPQMDIQKNCLLSIFGIPDALIGRSQSFRERWMQFLLRSGSTSTNANGTQDVREDNQPASRRLEGLGRRRALARTATKEDDGPLQTRA